MDDGVGGLGLFVRLWSIINKIVTHMVLDLSPSTSSVERMSKILKTQETEPQDERRLGL